MNRNSSEKAGRAFADAIHSAKTPCEEQMSRGLAFLAESIEELHAKIDKILEHEFKTAIVDSVENRLRAVGLIE